MEDALRVNYHHVVEATFSSVLILVLMEDALRVRQDNTLAMRVLQS